MNPQELFLLLWMWLSSKSILFLNMFSSYLRMVWGFFVAVLSTWRLGSFVKDWTCPLHWKHRVLSTGPPGKVLSEDVNNLFYLKKSVACSLHCLSVCVSVWIWFFPFNSSHVKDFNKMFSDPNCQCLLNSETLKNPLEVLQWDLSLMTGQFHCNIFLLEEWPTVVNIVNCRSFLWFKDSCSLLTRKAQAWLAGSWCM